MYQAKEITKKVYNNIYVALLNFSIYYTLKNIKSPTKNNKFKI